MNFRHEVPESIRAASTLDEDYGCWRAPDGRPWVYTDNPTGQAVSWRDEHGQPIAVAVWAHIPGDEYNPVDTP